MKFGHSAILDGIFAFGMGISIFGNILSGLFCIEVISQSKFSTQAKKILQLCILALTFLGTIALAAHIGLIIELVRAEYSYIAAGAIISLSLILIIVWSNSSKPKK